MSRADLNERQVSIDFDAATMAAEKGIQSSADHADADEEGWTFQALGMLTAFAAEHPQPFLIEEARVWAIAKGLPIPDNQKAWGAVTRMAVAKKRIEKCGAAAAASSNHSLKHLWRKVA